MVTDLLFESDGRTLCRNISLSNGMNRRFVW